MDIVILAKKRLATCDRVVRVAREAKRFGNNVKVISLEKPQASLRATTPGVEYIELPSLKKLITQNKSYKFKNFLMGQAKGLKVIFFPIKYLLITVLVCVLNIFKFLFPPRVKLSPKESAAYDNQDSIKNKFHSFRASIIVFIGNFVFKNQVQHLLKNNNVDICIAHDSFSIMAAKRLREDKACKIVCDVVEITWAQAGDALKYQPGWIKYIEKKLYKSVFNKAEFVMCTSPSEVSWVETTYGIKSATLIRNCREYIELEKKSLIKQDLGLNEQDKLILYVGNLHKNLYLESAVSALKFLDPKIHLAFIGKNLDNYMEKLNELALDAGTVNRLHFIPPRESIEFIKYIAGGDIGIISLQRYPLNTLYCLPNKIFEMTMARLPIAASRIQDIKELIAENQIGMIFDETDPVDIARVLNRMLQKEACLSLKENVQKAAKTLCWANEKKPLNDYLKSLIPSQKLENT